MTVSISVNLLTSPKTSDLEREMDMEVMRVFPQEGVAAAEVMDPHLQVTQYQHRLRPLSMRLQVLVLVF